MRAQQRRLRTLNNHLLVTCGGAATPALEGPYDAQLGPYPVGVTSMQLNDRDRADPESATGARSLLTEIWYPAAEVAREMPPNLFSDFLLRGVAPGSIEGAEGEAGLGGYREGITIAGLDVSWKNVAHRDAPVRELASEGARAEDGWPLIVFSHGSGGMRNGYVYLVEMLASHGYIVMAADHTGNARYTILDGAFVPAGGPRQASSAADRPHDQKFLIDEMVRMNAGADSRFAGRVNCSRVGAAGMSFGGYTTMAAAEIDPRICCVMPLAAGGPMPLGEKRGNSSTPAMVMVGTEDVVVSNEQNRQYYDETAADSYWVELKQGGHMTFASVDQYNTNLGNGVGKSVRRDGSEFIGPPPAESHAIINAYALGFFNVYLRGEQDVDGFLQRAHYGADVLQYESKVGSQQHETQGRDEKNAKVKGFIG